MWTGQFISPVGQTERAADNRIELVLSNVSSLTVESGDASAPLGQRGACLTAAPVTGHVVTDVSTALVFTDGRSLELSAGEHDFTLAALDAGGEVTDLDSRRPDLPATGGGAVFGLALLALAGRRRRATPRR